MNKLEFLKKVDTSRIDDEELVEQIDIIRNNPDKISKENIDTYYSIISDYYPELLDDKGDKKVKSKKAEDKSDNNFEKKPTKKKAGTVKSMPETVTIDGKEYTLQDCKDLVLAFKKKREANNEAVEKSENKDTQTKIADKVNIIIKHVANDPKVKEKIEKGGKDIESKLEKLEDAVKNLIASVEAILGKKLSKSQKDTIFSTLFNN